MTNPSENEDNVPASKIDDEENGIKDVAVEAPPPPYGTLGILKTKNLSIEFN